MTDADKQELVFNVGMIRADNKLLHKLVAGMNVEITELARLMCDKMTKLEEKINDITRDKRDSNAISEKNSMADNSRKICNQNSCVGTTQVEQLFE